MNASKLFALCVDILKTFKDNNVSADSHAEEFFELNDVKDEHSRVFVLEVFGNCIRFKKIMKVVLDVFYATDGEKSLPSDRHIYFIVIYLTLFRIDDLGTDVYYSLIASQNKQKIIKFFNFFLNRTNIMTWMNDEWKKIYEEEFVNEHLLRPLLKNFEYLTNLFKSMQESMLEEQQQFTSKFESKKPATVIEPFKLTNTKPRNVPEPKPIPQMAPARDVPETTYKQPTVDVKLVEKKQKNKQIAEERLMEANATQFSCASMTKSEKALKTIEKIKEEEDSKLRFNMSKCRDPPKKMTNDVAVKLNAAAILREGFHFQKKEDSEIERLQRLQSGEFDASNFLAWQQKMRDQDMQEEMALIEQRRIAGKISYEDAILAQEKLVQDNQKIVEEMKNEAAIRMREYLDQKMQEEEGMKQLVEQVITGHKNAKQARKKIQSFKHKLVQQMHAESKELLKRAFEEAEKEMLQRQEIIRQIRVLESAPRPRNKFVDLAEVPGYGFLVEMSILELRERLNLLRIERQKEEAEKRNAILQEKQAQEQNLIEKLEQINKYRAESTKAAAMRLEEKRAKHFNEVEEARKDPKVLEMEIKLAERKNERLLLQKNQKSAKHPPGTKSLSELEKQREQVERKRFQSVEQSKATIAALESEGRAFQPSTRVARIAVGPY